MNKSMKFLLGFVISLCVICMTFIVSSCARQPVNEIETTIESAPTVAATEATTGNTEYRDPRYRFVVVSDQIERDDTGAYYKNCEVYADLETGIMYLLIQKGNYGGVTVLYNTDGTPMMFDFEKGRPIIK